MTGEGNNIERSQNQVLSFVLDSRFRSEATVYSGRESILGGFPGGSDMEFGICPPSSKSWLASDQKYGLSGYEMVRKTRKRYHIIQGFIIVPRVRL
jgi:hypothetical protein